MKIRRASASWAMMRINVQLPRTSPNLPDINLRLYCSPQPEETAIARMAGGCKVSYSNLYWDPKKGPLGALKGLAMRPEFRVG